MCGELATVSAAVKEVQDQELAGALRKLFASERWGWIRKAHPGLSDLALLNRVVGFESLRCALCRGETIEFCDQEFSRRG